MFGKKAKQLRQWSLLGMLARRLPLVEALDFMDRGLSSDLVPWLKIRDDVASGASLSEAVAARCGADAPPELAAALRRGEADGSLLRELDHLDQTTDGAPFETAEETPAAVALVNQLLLDSSAKG